MFINAFYVILLEVQYKRTTIDLTAEQVKFVKNSPMNLSKLVRITIDNLKNENGSVSPAKKTQTHNPTNEVDKG